MEVRSKQDRNSGAYVGATLLIVIGLAALIANLGGGDTVYRTIPLGLGAAFLVAFALTRQYGFLVPGAILAGVGTGLLVGNALNVPDAGPYVALFGGLGFCAIYALDMIVSRTARRWWPLIPGALLVVAGASEVTAADQFTHTLQVWSPLVLVVIGVAILLARVRGRAS